jgi:hypothetical protein
MATEVDYGSSEGPAMVAQSTVTGVDAPSIVMRPFVGLMMSKIANPQPL